MRERHCLLTRKRGTCLCIANGFGLNGLGLLIRFLHRLRLRLRLGFRLLHRFCHYGRRFATIHILQPHQSHHVRHAPVRHCGVERAVIGLLHAVVEDEPRLHMVAPLLGDRQILGLRAIRTTETTDAHIGLPRNDVLTILVDKLTGYQDSFIIAHVRSVELKAARSKTEYNGRVGRQHRLTRKCTRCSCKQRKQSQQSSQAELNE